MLPHQPFFSSSITCAAFSADPVITSKEVSYCWIEALYLTPAAPRRPRDVPTAAIAPVAIFAAPAAALPITENPFSQIRLIRIILYLIRFYQALSQFLQFHHSPIIPPTFFDRDHRLIMALPDLFSFSYPDFKFFPAISALAPYGYPLTLTGRFIKYRHGITTVWTDHSFRIRPSSF